MTQSANDSGWRGSKELWLDAAFDSLIDSGIEAVRIQTLAQKLRLSRTSFYWFFQDREELLAAVLERWRSKNTGNLVRQAQAYAENIVEAALNVFDCWHDAALFDSRCEYAVRAWALRSPEVAVEVAEADAVRIEALKAMFRRFGHDEMPADVRARTLYLTQIGYISMRTEEGEAQRMLRVPDYVRIFTGECPQARDLDRFFARRGYDPRQQGAADPGMVQ
ncbi:MAG: TetR/AcrR family transcriptional regulator [Proteobacteria bacterium]|nr:TetR/AcrR family transcriptional regulator [Pseudomonadota bacterium]